MTATRVGVFLCLCTLLYCAYVLNEIRGEVKRTLEPIGDFTNRLRELTEIEKVLFPNAKKNLKVASDVMDNIKNIMSGKNRPDSDRKHEN